MERRTAVRISKRLACEFEIAGRTHHGFVLNLSERGVYLQTELAMAPGQEVVLRVSGTSFPDCELPARVVWRLLVPGLLSTVVRKGVGLELLAPQQSYLDAVADALGHAPGRGRHCEPDIEIDIALEEFEDAPTPRLAEPAAPPPSALEIRFEDDADSREPLEPPAKPDATEFAFSAEEWDALDPLETTARSASPGQLVLDVETLVVGDGDVDDVAILLDELGMNPVRMSAREAGRLSRLAVPPRLVVASARSALELDLEKLQPRGAGAALAVLGGDSLLLAKRLRRQGFGYLVRRPVDPDALRLLLARLTFRGGERRGGHRTVVGADVAVYTGLRRRAGFLLEVSEGGCSLLCAEEFGRGSRLTVRIPSRVTGARPLGVSGRVVRIERRRRPRSDGRVETGLAFERLSDRVEKRLAQLIRDYQTGPARLERSRVRGAAPDRPLLDGAVKAPAVNDPTAKDRAAADVAATHATDPPAAHHACAPSNAGSNERRSAETAPAAPPGPVPVPVPSSAAEAAEPGPRRHRRLALQHQALALEAGNHVSRVVFGTELSLGGMRIEPHPEIEMEDVLDLVIYAASTAKPAHVRAEVVRDDAAQGLALRFLDTSEADRAALAAILDQAPSLENESGSFVMTEIREPAQGVEAAES